MNTTTIRRTTAAVTATAAAVVMLTACGSSDSGSEATPTSPATIATTGAAAPAGKSGATVDGKAITAAFDTVCAKHGDTLALALTDNGNATYGQLAASATITGDSTVTAVGITGSKGGDNGMPYAVGYGNGVPGGSAKVVKNGNTYTVSGEGVGTPDLTNPLAGPKNSKFEIVFACTTVVGA